MTIPPLKLIAALLEWAGGVASLLLFYCCCCCAGPALKGSIPHVSRLLCAWQGWMPEACTPADDDLLLWGETCVPTLLTTTLWFCLFHLSIHLTPAVHNGLSHNSVISLLLLLSCGSLLCALIRLPTHIHAIHNSEPQLRLVQLLQTTKSSLRPSSALRCGEPPPGG